MPRGLILEGVTGAGKSSTLAALARTASRPAWLAGATLIPEEETIGDFMTEELVDPNLDDAGRCHRLWTLGARIEAAGGEAAFLLERFHLTYYALIPRWSLYAALDRRLAALDFSMVLLTVPEDGVRVRSLFRREADDWASGMIAYWGSEERALDAILLSQRRRIVCCAQSRLRSLRIDTSSEDWDRIASEIAAFSAVGV